MNKFEVLKDIITQRRSIKPALMNGKRIEDALIQELLQLGDWAPTHGHTEPWRFIIYSGEALDQFCLDHAEMYKTHTPPSQFTTGKYDKLRDMSQTVSHLVVVWMKRGSNPKIPALEEIAAAAGAVQNMLLGAAALGISALWSTGGMFYHPAMKEYFGLHEQDQMIGLLYMGYADEPAKAGVRIVPLEEKVQWQSK